MSRQSRDKQRAASAVREKRMVGDEVALDEKRLFGVSLKAAAVYLLEVHVGHQIAGLTMQEVWDDGMDAYRTAFVFERLETDAEFQNRCDREDAEAARAKEAAERERQRRRDIEEYNRLGDKLGRRR